MNTPLSYNVRLNKTVKAVAKAKVKAVVASEYDAKVAVLAPVYIPTIEWALDMADKASDLGVKGAYTLIAQAYDMALNAQLGVSPKSTSGTKSAPVGDEYKSILRVILADGSVYDGKRQNAWEAWRKSLGKSIFQCNVSALLRDPANPFTKAVISSHD